MSLNTLSVTKFNTIVKDIFNAEELLHNIKIVGEVFGVSSAKTAVYFSIKDEESSLPCICFYSDLLSQIKEGDSVVVTGSPNFYVKSGRFNFIVSRVEPFGQGLLYQRFLELKDKLAKEGIFDETHKKPMPKNIKRIGVVTSKDGAVIQDIKNVTWRRNRAIDIVLYDTKVQGLGAEIEIAQGIEFFSQYGDVDVVVVARGGGSLEDLAAYNTEVVARATYNCQKPIVSAVGHETDFTIIDFASDLRAPTPSVAAELLTNDSKSQLTLLKKDVSRFARVLENFIADKNLQLQNAKNSAVLLMEEKVESARRGFDKLVGTVRTKLDGFVVDRDYQLKLKVADLNKHNPLDILRLGYAKIEQNEKPVGGVSELDKNAPIKIYFKDGEANAEIKE
ncbi:MAG: exodeoxyribonuclease VII large subunit [Clostridia bacterium]|nr:exodeoxyribonuclease VII large subunit [Clostridia bacterium]